MSFWKGFKEGFKQVGQHINAIVISLLLSVVYFIGVGLTALVAKLFRKRFLEWKEERTSYWKELNPKKSAEEYYRQF